MSTLTLPRISGAGRKILNRLGVRIVREDGRDLRIPCVHGCGSEDNGHVDEDTGVYNCWSCQKGLSPWDLCKVVLGDHEAAKQAMIEAGLFQDLGPVNGSASTLPAVNGKLNADQSAFLEVCRLKNVPPDAWKAYGAAADQGGFRVPMFGPDGTVCSSIHITPANGKGFYEKGKSTGLFLPQRTPQPGETWIVVEGGKDAPALFAAGHLAAGLPSNRITEKFVDLFRDVHVTILTDGDKPGRDGGQKTAELLEGIAASVTLASFPDGMDARDVLKRDGPQGIDRALRGAKLKGVDYELITAAECLRRDYPQEFFVKDVLAKGEPMLIIAPSKACKTLIAADLAISLRKGGDFPGHFLRHFLVNRPVRTMMLWGESGWRGVQSNIRRIGMAVGVTNEDLEGLFVGVKLPKFGSTDHAAALDREIKRTGAQVVIIDCLYLCGVSGDTAKNQMEMGSLLASVKDVFVQNDCTLILLHHTTKHIAPGHYLQLDNAAFAGVAEFAAQWILINRRTDYIDGSGHHDLLLTIGGRAGHGGRYGVTIDEGQFVEGQDRDWNVVVRTPDEMRQAARNRQDEAQETERVEKLRADKIKVTRAMAALERQHPDGNAKTSIRDRSGLKGRFEETLSALLDDGAITECEFIRKDRKTPRQGYKLNSESIVTTVTENRNG